MWRKTPHTRDMGMYNMHKYISVLMCGFFAMAPFAARADYALDYDTSDPLYLQGVQETLTSGTLSYWDNVLRGGLAASFGATDRLALGANVHYQIDFDGREDGFSAIDLGGIYRLMRAGDNTAHMITDVLAGFKFGGSSHVRVPWFADSTYYAGLRFGRQWTGMTLAMTVKSSWIFDNDRGMSYIDFIPDAYFRINPDWRVGASFTVRKATNPHYNQEWLGGRVVRQYGRTQYIGHMDYEFEGGDLQIGAKVNVLF